jgi:hypothetical protein
MVTIHQVEEEAITAITVAETRAVVEEIRALAQHSQVRRNKRNRGEIKNG